MAELPTEILCTIVSHLPEYECSSRDAIKALCLTSSLFRTLCQPRLFKHIRLALKAEDDEEAPWDPEGIPTRPVYPGEMMHQTLTSSPHLIQYIEGITLYESNKRYWFEDDEALVEALALLDLQRITNIVLSRYKTSPPTRPWASLGTRFKEAVIRLCSAPSIVYLGLTGFPLRLASICGHNLKHLEIRDVESSNIELTGDPPSKSIESLRFYGRTDDDVIGTAALLDNAPGLDLGSLKDFRIFTYGSEGLPRFVSSILAKAGGSLERLTTQIYPTHGAPRVCRLIAENALALTKLEIWVDATFRGCHRHHSQPSDVLPTADLICQLPPTNLIEEVILFIHFGRPGWDGLGDDDVVSEIRQQLRRIGQALTDPERFPRFMKLHVRFNRDRHSEEGILKMSAILGDALGAHFRTPTNFSLTSVECVFYQEKRKTFNPLTQREED